MIFCDTINYIFAACIMQSQRYIIMGKIAYPMNYLFPHQTETNCNFINAYKNDLDF